MPRLCSTTLSLAFLLCTLTYGQQEIRIVDATAIVSDVSLANDRHVQASLQAAGIADDVIAIISKTYDPMKWPVGWRTDSARAANSAILVNAKAYKICDHAMDGGQLSLIHIPAIENLHMPEGMRTSEDIHVFIATEGLGEPEIVKVPPSKGPNWRSMPKAKITKPDQVYATYDLAEDSTALSSLEKRGLSKPEIDAVIFRSHERNWPEGIDDLEKRFPNLKHFKKFKTHLAAAWDGKVLLVIPAELNKNLPPRLRPYMDIYMVYMDPAVAVMKK